MSNEVTMLVKGVLQEAPDWLKVGNAGNEEVTGSDMTLPRIDVLQALSPQIKKSDPSYIPGAEQGQIFNTVTGEIYGQSVVVIPVMFRKEYVLWKLRKFGGGFLGAFRTEQEAKQNQVLQEAPDQCEVVESHQHFCLILTDMAVQQAVFSMTKSKLKASRTLNSLVQMAEVDRFAKAYRVEAIECSSPKGDYWGIRVKTVGFVNKDLYDKGKDLYDIIKTGQADIDRSVPDHDVESSAEI